MKCFSVNERGVTPGIALARNPYLHVGVGNPRIEYDYLRVEVDPALAGESGEMLARCSVELDPKPGVKRRASYKLVPPRGTDDDQALVKLDAHCAPPPGRTFYDLPHDTFMLAEGWFSDVSDARANTPAELIVLKKNEEVRVFKEDEPLKPHQLMFTLSFDGNAINVKK